MRYECENVMHMYTCQACGKQKLKHRLCDDYVLCASQTGPAAKQRHANAKAATAEAAGSAAE